MPNLINRQPFGLTLATTSIHPASARARRTIAQTLRLRGIAWIEFDYAGESGVGQWVNVQALDPDEEEYVLLSELDLHVWCAHQFGGLLHERYPDWNENTGSCGMFTWDVPRDVVLHTHFPSFDPRIAVRIKS